VVASPLDRGVVESEAFQGSMVDSGAEPSSVGSLLFFLFERGGKALRNRPPR
jgi:hypothetical protein